MSFRGINTTVIQIRRQVFTEVARMAYANVKGEQANHLMRKIPYTIIPGEEGKLRKDIFLERAIVEERVRLAMGLPTRRMDEHNSVVSGLEDASIADKYYDPPLVNVIKFACNRCPEKLVKVSDLCQGCLAHPCMEVCPKKAITWESGRSTIDQEKCIKCGRCATVCPYNAIVKTERPCAAACGMGAIHSDELGRAEIDYSKCVSCGQCLVNCPFGAIADKGQIYQLIQGFNRGDRIYALVAPAFINQFPSLASTGKLKAALKAIGFYDVVEVAIGADLCTVDEAHDFLEEVPGKLDFMATSCCPAWSMMAKTAFPALAKNISMTMTPMVFTARMMKQKDPTARMCFIGPCAAKKLEASRRTVRSDVDFVLTFEELAGIIEGKDLDIDLLEVDENEAALCSASAAGRGFAQSGGVANAVANKIKEWHPDMEVKIASAQGLADCKKLLMLAKAGAEVILLDEKGSELQNATTGEDVTYRFDGLMPGNYRLRVTLPNGYVVVEKDDTRLKDGQNISVMTTYTAREGESDLIALRMSQHQLEQNIGAVQPGTLGDFCWLDLNGNGLQDAGELGLGDMRIELWRNDQLVAETTTDAYGYYTFENLYPGVYTLKPIYPAEVVPTRMRTDIPLIASILGENGESNPVQVTSASTTYTADLGFVLVDDDVLPANYGIGEKQDWTKK